MDIEKVRGWQLAQVNDHLKTVESIIGMREPDELTLFRDGGTGWTALEVLCHLRDFEAIISERFHLTVEQDEPPLPAPKADELAVERHYNQQAVQSVMADWKQQRAKLIAYLQERSASDWERAGLHPTRGRLTLLDQLLLLPVHDSLHLEQMTRILSERRLNE